ncbi:hypothetical protein GCM10020358_39660 [Amorphoplanes nipponensis]|uniref:TIR domain-containing protein n=1 Tax=Actinoplanes nipponensis TaxID=135950 RepID=A0A919JI66_9ACTN|nr:toll/interleukin-1 receptor domain-containing protein [Actinoplanes nipponensis]GIE50996.1 hypothetical protein Ani05nite_45300 [Actinoplanes nipponensis]
MDTDLEAFTRAVGRVLPALNIPPDALELGPGAVRRMRRNPPWVRSLRGVRQLLVHVGAAGPADRAAARALAALTAAARQECERLLVVWDEPDDEPRAAVYAVTPRHELGALLATSWTDPVSWAEPMIDASRPVGEVLEDALARVRQALEPGRGEVDALERALRLVDLALRSAGGEGQHPHGRPASAQERSQWYDRYESSVRDEWHRVRGSLASARFRAVPHTRAGILSGSRVFVSYARPDAAGLARPVVEALRAQGADVWFDQEEPLDEGWLDVGLAAVIEECDAYVLCASDEFFERAGYATQEVAWAVRAWRAGSPLRSLVVVARPDTILPSIAQRWPAVTLPAGGAPDLGPALAARIREPAPPGAADPPAAGPPRLPGPAAAADRAALRARIRHRERLYATPPEAVTRIAGTSERDAADAKLAAELRRVGAGLDWDGSLVGHADWPADPLVRGYRWMLGVHRAIAGVRWPLSGSLDDLDDIAGDVQLLATRPPPILSWPDAPCWAAEERRLLVRFHVGELRLLEALLGRGLWAGLIKVPGPVLADWHDELPARRRECVDALIAMRLSGELSWQLSPPTWEKLYGDWYDCLAHPGPVFAELPAEVRLATAQQYELLSALAAQVQWHAVRSGGPVEQQVVGSRPVPVTYCAGVSAQDAPPPAVPVDGRSVSLQLCPGSGGWLLRTEWHGFTCPDGVAVAAAPEALRQSMNPSSA